MLHPSRVYRAAHTAYSRPPADLCSCALDEESAGVTGVPLKDSVAGVAMGLILEADGQFVILTDILGSEDALGDMDFKVAGTADGVTAFQMDIKARPLPH